MRRGPASVLTRKSVSKTRGREPAPGLVPGDCPDRFPPPAVHAGSCGGCFVSRSSDVLADPTWCRQWPRRTQPVLVLGLDPRITRDGSDHDLFQLFSRHHLAIALAQSGLCLPRNLPHSIGHRFDGLQLAPRDARRKAVAVRCLDQHGAGVDVAGPRVKRPRASLGDRRTCPWA